MEIKTITFKKHGDERGLLVAVEAMKDIPFEIKRVYYITGADRDIRRGFHAHKKLQQVLLCVNGSCKIMLDNGKEKADIELSEPNFGLVIENNMWREMYDFSDNAVLLVLASEHYDEADYIRNYDDFIKYVKENEI